MDIDHVGIVTADLNGLAALYSAAFGLTPAERECLPAQGVEVLWLAGSRYGD